MNKDLLQGILSGVCITSGVGMLILGKLLEKNTKDIRKAYELGEATGKVIGVYESYLAIAKDVENNNKKEETEFMSVADTHEWFKDFCHQYENDDWWDDYKTHFNIDEET